MNKDILLAMISLFFISCENDRETTFELTKSLINKTNTVLFYVVETNDGNDSAFISGYDSTSFLFKKVGLLEDIPPVGAYSINIEGVNVTKEIVYNLTDTTVFKLNPKRYLWDSNDSLYWKMIVYKAEGGGYHEKHYESLLFTDSLKSIMQKDYTMLQKFKEYYEK